MRQEAALFGFREVATPIFESTELFTLRSGPNVIEEIYAFQDKGGRDIALRPELTAPVMRFFVNELTNEPRPLKLFYFGQCFRYERPQAGRYREFFQFGAEVIGGQGPEADAEAMALAASIMRRVGLEPSIRMGHIGVLRGLLAENGLEREAAAPVLQKLDKKEFDAASELLAAAGVSHSGIARVLEVAGTVGGPEALSIIDGPAREHLEAVLAILKEYGVANVQVDLGVVRGLDYYTGVVFEMDAPSLGAEKQVCGGGAYALTEIFGGEKVGSVGFGIGFDRTLLALENQGWQSPTPSVDAFVVPVNDAMRPHAARITAGLRGAGVSADTDIAGRSMSKSMKHAAAVNARFAVIIGAKELADGTATVRDMASGDQSAVPLSELASRLRS